MSFIQRLFSFLDSKNDEKHPIPTPEYPFAPTYLPKKRTNSFIISKTYNQAISTQTDQTISNLTEKESETEISIPASFIPKETFFPSHSSRFTSTNEEVEKSKQFKKIEDSSINNSQNSEPEDSKNIQNEDNSSHEFTIGSNQSFNNISNNETISNTHEVNDIKRNDNQNTKESSNVADTFSSFNFKKNSDTFSSFNFKSKGSNSKPDTSSGFNFENNAGIKAEEDKKESDTFSSFNFKPKEDKKESDTFSSFNFKSKENKNESASSQEKKEEVNSADTFSFMNFKSKQNTTNNAESQKSQDLDLDKIKAMLKERYPKPVFSTKLNTNFYSRGSVIQNETGGFNYSYGSTQHSYDRRENSGPKRGRGGKSKFNRSYNE